MYHAIALYRKREFKSGGGPMKITTALDKVYKEIEIMQQFVNNEQSDCHCIQLHNVLIVDTNTKSGT